MAKSGKSNEFIVNGITYKVISSEGIIGIKKKIENSSPNDFLKVFNAEYENFTKKSIKIPQNDFDKIIWKSIGASRRTRKIQLNDLLDYCSQVEEDYNKARKSNSERALANSTPADIKKLIKATETQNAKVVSNLQEITNSINDHMDKIHKDNLKQIKEAEKSSKTASEQAQEASKQAKESIDISRRTMRWTIAACIATLVSCFATIVFGYYQNMNPKNKDEMNKKIELSELQPIDEPQVFDENKILSVTQSESLENNQTVLPSLERKNSNESSNGIENLN